MSAVEDGVTAARERGVGWILAMEGSTALSAGYCMLLEEKILIDKLVDISPAPAAVINKQKQPLVTVQVKWGNMAVGLEVSDLLAVKELRAELGAGAAKLPLPKDGGYFFIYKQNVMEEDRTLRWHDVKNGDTIEIFNGQVTGGA
ncbi:hypothetical protein ABZP36_034687 [Zizania latifolia]